MKEAIKKLRELTGFGISDCKKALEESDGDVEKALDYLRKRGAKILEEKSHRQTREGVIEAYIHFSQNLGAMVEINCESDFVARNPDFKKFAKDIAMQVAAGEPQYISSEEVPPEVIEKLSSSEKEEFFRKKCLLSQPYLKDSTLTVQDYLNSLGAKFKENIVIKRFVRFSLGE